MLQPSVSGFDTVGGCRITRLLTVIPPSSGQGNAIDGMLFLLISLLYHCISWLSRPGIYRRDSDPSLLPHVLILTDGLEVTWLVDDWSGDSTAVEVA